MLCANLQLLIALSLIAKCSKLACYALADTLPPWNAWHYNMLGFGTLPTTPWNAWHYNMLGFGTLPTTPWNPWHYNMLGFGTLPTTPTLGTLPLPGLGAMLWRSRLGMPWPDKREMHHRMPWPDKREMHHKQHKPEEHSKKFRGVGSSKRMLCRKRFMPIKKQALVSS